MNYFEILKRAIGWAGIQNGWTKKKTTRLFEVVEQAERDEPSDSPLRTERCTEKDLATTEASLAKARVGTLMVTPPPAGTGAGAGMFPALIGSGHVVESPTPLRIVDLAGKLARLLEEEPTIIRYLVQVEDVCGRSLSLTHKFPHSVPSPVQPTLCSGAVIQDFVEAELIIEQTEPAAELTEPANDDQRRVEAFLPAPDQTTPSSGVVSQESKAADRREVVQPILTDKGWSLFKWATEANVDPRTVGDYMKGKTKPQAKNRKAMAKALGLEAKDLP